MRANFEIDRGDGILVAAESVRETELNVEGELVKTLAFVQSRLARLPEQAQKVQEELDQRKLQLKALEAAIEILGG